MTIKVSTLKNGEARQRVMTIRLNTLLVSCYANGEFFRDGFIELFPRGNFGIVCNKQFRLNGEPLEITPDDWTPYFLGENGIQRKKQIAYEKIMKYVD